MIKITKLTIILLYISFSILFAYITAFKLPIFISLVASLPVGLLLGFGFAELIEKLN